jgi:hypothetical protein
MVTLPRHAAAARGGLEPVLGERPAAGHRSVSHTADVQIESWAPSRKHCVVEAVAASASSLNVDCVIGSPGSTGRRNAACQHGLGRAALTARAQSDPDEG